MPKRTNSSRGRKGTGTGPERKQKPRPKGKPTQARPSINLAQIESFAERKVAGKGFSTESLTPVDIELIDQFAAALEKGERNDLLAMRAKLGDRQALNKLIAVNGGFQYFLIEKFLGLGIERVVLMQLARIGYFKAVPSFDPRTAKFATWCRKFVKHEVVGEVRTFIGRKGHRRGKKILFKDPDAERRFFEKVGIGKRATRRSGTRLSVPVLKIIIKEVIPTLTVIRYSRVCPITDREAHILSARLGIEGKIIRLGTLASTYGLTLEGIRQIEKVWKRALGKQLKELGIEP